MDRAGSDVYANSSGDSLRGLQQQTQNKILPPDVCRVIRDHWKNIPNDF
jgi:hypothetical protein